MLHIITPCSRPENLVKIFGSIFSVVPTHDWGRIFWHIIVDAAVKDSGDLSEFMALAQNNRRISVIFSPHKKALVGHAHRNFFLDNFFPPDANQWLYFLDDDTMLHKDFWPAIRNEMIPSRSAIVFNQNHANGLLRLIADISSIKVGYIDMGMYLVNASHIPAEMRFDEKDYCADGIFIEEFCKHIGKPAFTHINKVLSTYNQLR